jgi:ribosomal protein L11 methyltransferase
VLANILATPLIELSQSIAGLVKPAGSLVLSGILTEQATLVGNAYAPLFAMSKPISQDDWCRLDGIKFG